MLITKLKTPYGELGVLTFQELIGLIDWVCTQADILNVPINQAGEVIEDFGTVLISWNRKS